MTIFGLLRGYTVCRSSGQKESKQVAEVHVVTVSHAISEISIFCSVVDAIET